MILYFCFSLIVNFRAVSTTERGPIFHIIPDKLSLLRLIFRPLPRPFSFISHLTSLVFTFLLFLHSSQLLQPLFSLYAHYMPNKLVQSFIPLASKATLSFSYFRFSSSLLPFVSTVFFLFFLQRSSLTSCHRWPQPLQTLHTHILFQGLFIAFSLLALQAALFLLSRLTFRLKRIQRLIYSAYLIAWLSPPGSTSTQTVLSSLSSFSSSIRPFVVFSHSFHVQCSASPGPFPSPTPKVLFNEKERDSQLQSSRKASYTYL